MHSFLIYKIQSKIESSNMIKKVRKTTEVINDIFKKASPGEDQGKNLRENPHPQNQVHKQNRSTSFLSDKLHLQIPSFYKNRTLYTNRARGIYTTAAFKNKRTAEYARIGAFSSFRIFEGRFSQINAHRKTTKTAYKAPAYFVIGTFWQKSVNINGVCTRS